MGSMSVYNMRAVSVKVGVLNSRAGDRRYGSSAWESMICSVSARVSMIIVAMVYGSVYEFIKFRFIYSVKSALYVKADNNERCYITIIISCNRGPPPALIARTFDNVYTYIHEISTR